MLPPTKGSRVRFSAFRLYLLVAALSAIGSLAGVLMGRGPVRNGADEFAYLLGGQTFAAGRLTNPSHPLWQFFETYHVLSRPSYMPKYPPAQSLTLALGEKIGAPILGVWLAGMGFAVATTWLLRARLAARWAFLGGCLTLLQFGVTHYYTQSYWGGAVAATAGALVLGATLRLHRVPSARNAAWLGVGVAIGLLSRPFETALLCLIPAGLGVKWLCLSGPPGNRYRQHLLLLTAPIIFAAVLFQTRFNAAVTGDWRRLPYTAYEEQYSGAPLFVWQNEKPTPEFHNEVMAIFHRNFVLPSSRFNAPAAAIWIRRLHDVLLASLGPVFGFAGVLGLFSWRCESTRWLTGVIAVSSLGFLLSYWFFPHYYAGLHGAWIFLGVQGLRLVYLKTRTRRWPFPAFALAVFAACAVARIATDEKLRPWVGDFARARQGIEDQLNAAGEKHLIFVRRLRPFNFHFLWVYNNADIDGSSIVWAHDKGPEVNQTLINYYHGTRRLWLLTERNDEPRLTPLPPPP